MSGFFEVSKIGRYGLNASLPASNPKRVLPVSHPDAPPLLRVLPQADLKKLCTGNSAESPSKSNTNHNSQDQQIPNPPASSTSPSPPPSGSKKKKKGGGKSDANAQGQTPNQNKKNKDTSLTLIPLNPTDLELQIGAEEKYQDLDFMYRRTHGGQPEDIKAREVEEKYRQLQERNLERITDEVTTGMMQAEKNKNNPNLQNKVTLVKDAVDLLYPDRKTGLKPRVVSSKGLAVELAEFGKVLKTKERRELALRGNKKNQQVPIIEIAENQKVLEEGTVRGKLPGGKQQEIDDKLEEFKKVLDAGDSKGEPFKQQDRAFNGYVVEPEEMLSPLDALRAAEQMGITDVDVVIRGGCLIDLFLK